MIHSETNIVKPDISRDSLEKCYYCKNSIGELHKSDCVMRCRTITVDIKIKTVLEIPQFWDKKEIDFYLNDSSVCSNYFIDLIKKHEPKDCWCYLCSFEYIREATKIDEENLPSNIIKGDYHIKENFMTICKERREILPKKDRIFMSIGVIIMTILLYFITNVWFPL